MEEQCRAYISTTERQQALQRAQSLGARFPQGAIAGYQHVQNTALGRAGSGKGPTGAVGQPY
eukprot:1768064-Karenia_brevis.AAC.1